MHKSLVVALIISLALVSCYEPVVDESTFSNILEVKTLHYDLNVTLNFTTKSIHGSIVHTFKTLASNVTVVNLDVQGLDIFSVYDEENNRLPFNVTSPYNLSQALGDKLSIRLAKVPEVGTTFKITIFYKTNNNGTALSWLTPEQTSTKVLPYLFSQCEASHCRSIAPLQDTPQVKSTFRANITVQNPIKVFVCGNLMNTINDTQRGITVFQYEMPWPIASYLLSVVAGNLAIEQVGNRTYVISEPDQMPIIKYDLANMEQFLTTTEDYIIPYTWRQYKLVILPPSFPFGGMENPLLTFASPSIITGDRSGVNVAIHEIVHSWTGNLVTCRNWKNMWMNEGFTVFMERKAVKTLLGQDYYLVEALNGNDSMVSDMSLYGFNHSFSSLFPNVTRINPDDSYSTVPYEKGFQFLTYIEQVITPVYMQKLLRAYVSQNANQSVVWETFRNFTIIFLNRELGHEVADQLLKKIDWEAWVIQPGLPPVTLNFSSPLISEAKQLAEDYIRLNGSASPDNFTKMKSWYPNAQFVFLQYLINNYQRLNVKIIARIDGDYNFTFNNNKEILWRWYQASILGGYFSRFEQRIHWFLGSIGRMKMIRPVYQALVQVGLKNQALQYFAEYQNFYHPIALAALQIDLGLRKNELTLEIPYSIQQTA